MTIICNLKGGYGNHLYNVMLALLYYDKTHVPLHIVGNHIVGDTEFQRNDTRTTIYKVINPAIVTNTIDKLSAFHINSFDIYISVLNNIASYIQYNLYIDIIGAESIKFYRDNIDIILKYIIIPPPPTLYLNSNSIIVSLRLGMGINEISQPSPFAKELRLPFIYFKDAISKITASVGTVDRIYICSDNYVDSFIDNFLTEYGSKVVLLSDKNTLEQCSILVHGAHVVSSNSSFSLISTLMNTSGTVYIPEFKSSGAAYPHSSNARYRDALYTWAPNTYHINIED